MKLRLGAGPVSWGVDFADDPNNPSWPEVFDGIAEAVRWTELGPIGYLPEDPKVLQVELGNRELNVAGSFVFQPLHEPEKLEEIVDIARRTCALIAALGGRFLVIIDQPCKIRAETAGRPKNAERLDDIGWAQILNGIRAVAKVAREEFGLRPVFHPHAGSYVEFEDEIERLLASTSEEELGLCIDTGHCAYAGVDSAQLIRRHPSRLEYLHFKDIDGIIHSQVVSQGIDFWNALKLDVFCPLGAGVVDFKELEKVLSEINFEGWGTIEQDRRPNSSRSPLEDLRASVDFLTSCGIGVAR